MRAARQVGRPRAVCAGGQDGAVQVFDLVDGQPSASWRATTDTVNGFAFHPYLPLGVTASGLPDPLSACCSQPADAGLTPRGAAGHRRLPASGLSSASSDSDEADTPAPSPRRAQPQAAGADSNCLRVWRFATAVGEGEPEPASVQAS